MDDQPVVLTEAAFALYQQLKKGRHTTKDTALKLDAGAYSKAAWDDLRPSKAAVNVAGGGKRYVLLHLVPEVKVAPEPRVKQRRPSRAPKRTSALTVDEVRDFLAEHDKLTKKLVAERTKQAEQRLQDAQKALQGLSPGKEFEDALGAAGRANKAYSEVATSTAAEVLAQLKPARTSTTYKLWELLGGR